MLRQLRGPLGAALLCAALFVSWAVTLPTTFAMGWDEAMHAGLPAARMLAAVAEGELSSAARTLHECQQYPPAWPVLLAVVEALFGSTEQVARLATLAAWCVALFGLYLLGVELVRSRATVRGAASRGDELVPWLLLAFGALSPLALDYAGTLFLEVPFTLVAVFSLRAWLRRGEAAGARGELVAGGWLTLAFFTKFNYGLLLGFGLALDLSVELALAWRAGALAAALRRSAALALLPLCGALWWFVLPLPEGFETAARHRAAFLAFLSGNRELAPTPWAQRALFWVAYLGLSARLFLAQLVGVFASLGQLSSRGPRMLWLVWLGAGVPVWVHNFHLDRFLIPGAPAFWALAALGLAQLLPTTPRARALTVGGLALLTLALPSLDTLASARRLGLLSEKPEVLALQRRALESWTELGARRPLPSAGARRETFEGLLDLVSSALGPEERLGWFGTSSELSPGALHLALLERGGSRQRFLRDSALPLDVTFEALDPEWDAAQLADFAAGFDVIFSTDPPDLGGRRGRAFITGYSQRLVEQLGWDVELLGEVSLAADSGPQQSVRLYALRPPR